MTKAPILALPNFSLPFVLETNTSRLAMGVVLMQQGHPIAFFNKLFGPRMKSTFTYICKPHTNTTVVRKWRQYLLGHQFTIPTNHKSLKDLMSWVIQTPEQQFYLTKLFGYDYLIQYKSGKSNVMADALSRIEPILAN